MDAILVSFTLWIVKDKPSCLLIPALRIISASDQQNILNEGRN